MRPAYTHPLLDGREHIMVLLEQRYYKIFNIHYSIIEKERTRDGQSLSKNHSWPPGYAPPSTHHSAFGRRGQNHSAKTRLHLYRAFKGMDLLLSRGKPHAPRKHSAPAANTTASSYPMGISCTRATTGGETSVSCSIHPNSLPFADKQYSWDHRQVIKNELRYQSLTFLTTAQLFEQNL